MRSRIYAVLCLGVLGVIPAAAEPAEPDPAAPPAPTSSALAPSHLYEEAARALPDWWKFGLEIRGRWDTFDGTAAVPGRFDSYYMNRLRLNSTFTIRPWLRIFAQAQDSRTTDYTQQP